MATLHIPQTYIDIYRHNVWLICFWNIDRSELKWRFWYFERTLHETYVSPKEKDFVLTSSLYKLLVIFKMSKLTGVFQINHTFCPCTLGYSVEWSRKINLDGNLNALAILLRADLFFCGHGASKKKFVITSALPNTLLAINHYWK